MTHKVIIVEFVVPTLFAIVLGIVLSIGTVYLTDKHLVPIDQTEANHSVAGSHGFVELPNPDGRLSRVHLLLQVVLIASPGRARAEGEEMTTPNHLERQFMERLQGVSWVKAFTLPSSPTVIDRLLNKGWIEKDRIEGRLCYRMTDQGLAAKKMRV